MSKGVTILLSTFNGATYLREQLDSILNQEGVKTRILVRDDGSKDETISILNDYQNKGLLSWYSGENLGAARSFLKLLEDAPEDDFYAFCDQDDFWISDKLKTAVNSLDGDMSEAKLYFCQPQIVDNSLSPIETIQDLSPYLTLGEALIHEFCSGCTVVINSKMRNIINTYSPKYLPMHDMWTYGVALSIGAKVVFDKTSHILYRQHNNNAIGMNKGILYEWKLRINRFWGGEHSRYRRAQELKKGFYNLMSKENQDVLDTFLNGKLNLSGRIRLLRDNRFVCSDKKTLRLFKLAVLLNTY